MLLAHESPADALESARQLRAMGGHARRLLEELVATQGVTRAKVSKAASGLHDAGFIFLRDTGDLCAPEYTLTPALLGEEALEALEQMEKPDAGPASDL
jgi:hypothetical protein